MKLLKMLVFLLISFIGMDYGVGALLHTLSTKSQIRFSKLYYGTNNADLVILGNSRAVNSFYAPYLESTYKLKTLNLAYNGLSMPIIKVLLDDYLKSNMAPRYVAIEVTSLESSYKVLPNLKQYMIDSPSIKGLVRTHYPDIYNASLLSRAFIYNSEYFLRTLYYLRKSDQSWINRYAITKELYEQLSTSSHKIALFDKLDEDSITALNEIIHVCDAYNIEVILILAPVIDKVRDKVVINNYIARIENSTGLEVVNLSGAINDIDMFADSIHTNEKGARFLADIMRDRGLFLDENTSL